MRYRNQTYRIYIKLGFICPVQSSFKSEHYII